MAHNNNMGMSITLPQHNANANRFFTDEEADDANVELYTLLIADLNGIFETPPPSYSTSCNINIRRTTSILGTFRLMSSNNNYYSSSNNYISSNNQRRSLLRRSRQKNQKESNNHSVTFSTLRFRHYHTRKSWLDFKKYSDSEEYSIDEYEYERLLLKQRNSNENLVPLWLMCDNEETTSNDDYWAVHPTAAHDNNNNNNNNNGKNNEKSPPLRQNDLDLQHHHRNNYNLDHEHRQNVDMACHDLDANAWRSGGVACASSSKLLTTTTSRHEKGVGRVLFQRYFVGSSSRRSATSSHAASSTVSSSSSTNTILQDYYKKDSNPKAQSNSKPKSKQKIYPNPEPRRDFLFDAAEVQDNGSPATVIFSRPLLIGGC